MSKLIFTDVPTDNNTNASDGKTSGILTPSMAKKDANAIPQSILCYQHCHQTDSKHLTQEHPHLPTQGWHQSQRQ